MNNSILIIDKRNREDALIAKLSKAISNIGNTSQAISLLHYNFKHKQYERLDSSGQWQKIEQPVQVSVRLRHDSDMEPADMPRGLLSIRYSGYSGGIPSQTHDTLGFEYGIPHGISSKEEEAKVAFVDQWASELIQFLISGNVPIFLTKWTFNAILEKALLEKLSTFSLIDVSYRRLNEDNGEGEAINIAPFQPNIFQIFSSNSITSELDTEINEFEEKLKINIHELTEIKDEYRQKEIEEKINAIRKKIKEIEHKQIEKIENANNYDFIGPNAKGVNLKFRFTPPLKVLIIWPGDINHQKILSKLGGSSYHYRHDAFKKITTVTTEADLNNLVDLSEYDFAILPAELRWKDTQYLTDLHGVNVAGQLRHMRFAGITLLASMAPTYIAYHLQKETIKKWNEADKKGRNQDLEVLNMGFTYVWDISGSELSGAEHLSENIRQDAKASWKNLQNDQKVELEAFIENSYGQHMSPGRLADVIYSLLSAGKLSAVIHEYRRTTQDTDKIQSITQAAKYALASIEYIVDPLKIPDLKKLAQHIIEEIEKTKGNLREARIILEERRKDFETLLPYSKSGEENRQQDYNRGWGILLLEDDIDTVEQISKLLLKYNIPKWHARNSIDAIKILQKDYAGELHHPPSDENNGQSLARNFIRVVLADIRLQNLTKESSRWDIMQGYEFVDKVNSSMSNFVTTVILTQQEQRILRRSSAINPIWFPKSILRGEGNQELFMEKVLELGEQKTPPIPDSELWRNGYLHIHQYPFAVYYKQYRIDLRYLDNEQWVNNAARLFFKLWLCSENLGLNEEVEKIQLSIRNQFRGIQITDGITRNLRQEKILPLFRAKLAARRAALTIGEYIIYNDIEISEIENRITDLKIEFEQLLEHKRLEKNYVKEINAIQEKMNKIILEIKDLEAKSKIVNSETPESDIEDRKNEFEKLKLVAQKYKTRKNTNREFINTEDEQEYEKRFNNLQDEKKMFLNDVIFKILFFVRNFRLPELAEMDDDIDRILLNRHLGLDGKPQNWSNENNLLLEERAWLQSMRQSGWE